MSTEYTIVIEKDEDGYYVGSVPTLLLVILLMLLSALFFLRCSSPLEKQLTEVNRLKLLETETERSVREQETNIRSDLLEFEEHVKRRRKELLAILMLSFDYEKSVESCEKAVTTNTEVPEWVEWNDRRKWYEEELAKNNSVNNEVRLYSHMRNEPTLTLDKCKKHLPALQDTLQALHQTHKIGSDELIQRKVTFEKQIEKMMADLDRTKAAFDSIKALHTQAVFALSKMKSE